MTDFYEHLCMVCGRGFLSHDPRHAITGEYMLTPLCCHGCGCGSNLIHKGLTHDD